MEKRINVAELLRNCPRGMELNCVIFDNISLVSVDDRKDVAYPIKVLRKDGYHITLTKYGQYNTSDFAKCIIFPKGKTTWEGFEPPCKFNEGDVVVNASNKYSNAFIYAGENNEYYKCYVGLKTGTNPALSTNGSGTWVDKKSGIRLATEGEREKLFKAIKDNGYKWNPETKVLEKLVEPKFKVRYRIKYKNGVEQGVIKSITDDTYNIAVTNNTGIFVPIANQDDWELVPNKFDITNLKRFEKVLVRGSRGQKWTHDFFGFIDKDKGCPFVCVGHYVIQCIPYEGNEHLLGKTDDCDEYYKYWKE